MAILFVADGAKTSGSDGPRSKRCALAALVCLLGAQAAPGAACPAANGAGVTVTAVARTGEISLADGRILRLAGIDWPPVDRPGARDRLRTVVIRLVEGATATIGVTGPRDRWGRHAGHLVLHAADGPPQPLWLQETLLALGLTRAWPEPSLAPCWQQLLAAEAQARQAGLGLWSPLLRRTHRALARQRRQALSSRAVFEARVRSVRTGRTATFVNFDGPRPETPFVLLRNRDLSSWRKEGLDPATFSGKRLRVRGILSSNTTPRLELAGPMAVDVLE